MIQNGQESNSNIKINTINSIFMVNQNSKNIIKKEYF